MSTVSGGRRWKDARGAAAWVLAKLTAAEQLWSLTQPPYVDYSLAMIDASDEDFFMTENAQVWLSRRGSLMLHLPGGLTHSCPSRLHDAYTAHPPQELLGAAGFRDDDGDYFKIPGNGGPSWRARVRAAIAKALEQLEQEVRVCENVLG